MRTPIKMNNPFRYMFWKSYWFFANRIRTMYRFFRRPDLYGSKVVVWCDGRILLVKINYGNRLWTLPGGNADRGETYEDCARRELLEETKVVAGELKFLREYDTSGTFYTGTTRVFVTEVQDPTLRIDPVEITEAYWFLPDQLPIDRGHRIDDTLKCLR